MILARRPRLNSKNDQRWFWFYAALLIFLLISGAAWADYGQVKQVKGGTIQRTNQDRHLNTMLMLDDPIYEQDLIRGDPDAQAMITTVHGDWYLGKNIMIQLSDRPRPLLTMAHGQFKIVSPISLDQAPPIRVDDLEIQFMHKFGLVEEGEGNWQGTWLIAGLAVLKLHQKPEPQRFELDREDLLISYSPAKKTLTAYPLKRSKFLREANSQSFWRDYLTIFANEVFTPENFVAVTPTPVPLDRRIIQAPQDQLAEGEESKVNLTGDPDAFLQEYFQRQLNAQKAKVKGKSSKKKAKK